MALEGGVHAPLQLQQSTRIGAKKVRPQLGDAGADTVGVGGQIERTQRANLAVASDAGVGVDADDGAVKDGDGLAAGPFVSCPRPGATRRGRP